MTDYELEQLIEKRPSLHRQGNGSKANWGVIESVLRFIYQHSRIDCRTIEVGAGLSTIAFVIAGCEHHAIFPEPYLKETVLDYLYDNRISAKRLHIHNGYSQEVLPNLEESDFDMALIDGEHAFPIPFLDWYYIAKKLKPGAFLIIDDTQIWTGQVLRNFLLLEPEWRLFEEFYGTAIFRLEVQLVEKWWAKQAYTLFHSQITHDTLQHIPAHALQCMHPLFNTDD